MLNKRLILNRDNLRYKLNLFCPHCLGKLRISDLINYSYVCKKCDENFYNIEVIKDV